MAIAGGLVTNGINAEQSDRTRKTKTSAIPNQVGLQPRWLAKVLCESPLAPWSTLMAKAEHELNRKGLSS